MEESKTFRRLARGRKSQGKPRRVKACCSEEREMRPGEDSKGLKSLIGSRPGEEFKKVPSQV